MLPFVMLATTAPTAAWSAIFSELPSFHLFFAANTWSPLAASSQKSAAVSWSSLIFSRSKILPYFYYTKSLPLVFLFGFTVQIQYLQNYTQHSTTQQQRKNVSQVLFYI